MKTLTILFAALAMCGCATTNKNGNGTVPNNWGETIRLTNGEIEIVIAPERGGRLMHYSRPGESNLLWTAADINSGLGDMWGWRNWGGEKTWLWPQDDWPGDIWPPPADIEQAPWKLEEKVILPKLLGYQITLSAKTQFGKMTRSFVLPAHGTRLAISATLENTDNAFAVWSVVQIPVPEIVGVNRTGPRQLLLQLPDDEEGMALVMRDENTFDLAATPGGTKGMLDADTFRVPTAQGVLVVRQLLYGGNSAAEYGDVYQAQICKINALDGDAYVELEFAAPLNAAGASRQTVTLSLE